MNKQVLISPMDYMRCKTLGELFELPAIKAVGVELSQLEYWTHPAHKPVPPPTSEDEIQWTPIYPDAWGVGIPAFTLEVKPEFQTQFGFNSLVVCAS